MRGSECLASSRDTSQSHRSQNARGRELSVGSGVDDGASRGCTAKWELEEAEAMYTDRGAHMCSSSVSLARPDVHAS